MFNKKRKAKIELHKPTHVEKDNNSPINSNQLRQQPATFLSFCMNVRKNEAIKKNFLKLAANVW